MVGGPVERVLLMSVRQRPFPLAIRPNPFRIRTSMTPLPQPLYNPHLQTPLVSAGNKGVITPLESVLTANLPVSSLKSALPKSRGEGVFWLARSLGAQRFRFRPQPALKGFGGGTSLGAYMNFGRRQLLHSLDFAVEFCFVTRKGTSLKSFWRIA